MRPALYLRESHTVGNWSISMRNLRPIGALPPDPPRSIKIPNLYGRYFAVCVNNRNSGAGAIQNS